MGLIGVIMGMWELFGGGKSIKCACSGVFCVRKFAFFVVFDAFFTLFSPF